MNYITNCIFFHTLSHIDDVLAHYTQKIVQKEHLLESSDIFFGKPVFPVFFDIETTGLSWRNSHLYILGCCYPVSSGKWKLEQWFLTNPSGEKEMIEAFFSQLAIITEGKHTLLIHYNGDTFDLPYIRNKCDFYRISYMLMAMPSLDIYRILRPFRKLFRLNSMKQKDVEKFCGIAREDIYSGKELIRIYKEYIQSGDEELLRKLLLHNAEDISCMPGIMPALFYPMLWEGVIFFEDIRVIFPGNASAEKRFIDSQTPESSNMVTLLAVTKEKFPEQAEVRNEFGDIHISGNLVRIRLYAENCTMYHFFDNYKDYYYLPDEDCAVHKSVGQFVEPEHRRKASKNNCYQKKTDIFLPQKSILYHPVMYPDIHRRHAYFPASELQRSGPEKLNFYLKDLFILFRP